MDQNLIALRIKNIREYRNYTQAFVAYKLNIKQNTYSHIENGMTEIKYSRLEKIAAILNFPLEQLLNQDFEILNTEKNSNKKFAEDLNNTRFEKMISELKCEINYLKKQNDKLFQAILSLKENE